MKRYPHTEIILNKLRGKMPYLRAKYPIKSLTLFGSITRNDFTESSDIDILVELNAPMGLNFVSLANELENILERKVDLVTRSAIKPKYYKYVEEDIIDVEA